MKTITAHFPLLIAAAALTLGLSACSSSTTEAAQAAKTEAAKTAASASAVSAYDDSWKAKPKPAGIQAPAPAASVK